MLNSTSSKKQSTQDSNIVGVLKEYGLSCSRKLACSLQGSVWKARDAHGKQLVVKVTSKRLYESATAKIEGNYYPIQEDIKKEAQLLHYLTAQQHSAPPPFIVKFVAFFESTKNYYLIMEHGGGSLFEFVVKAHNLIVAGKLDIEEWHNCVKIIYKQLMDAIHFIHSKNVCHFDVSLENLVINDVKIVEDQDTNKIRFVADSIRIKLIDFGLADLVAGGRKSTKFVGKDVYKSPEVLAKNEHRGFDAKSNDIFCSGVCLFCMILGTAPWSKASEDDRAFMHIFNDKMLGIVQQWHRLHYITVEIVHLLSNIFKYESERISMKGILQHQWLRT
mmetsp:Transcript_23258/g.37260  ORF Transcript_23258/g.37260 Transcript_23258/m.37260 type:complete len:332 (+) Transcript_23258:94-1089(+)|eukprot:CAMPEP_0202688226 /NCGR_PEP_ID=MMETSP1385-20130828/3756_1 /ASSEMBLY_ACC=CAM_ASM_000861 /TAXON_ID=933848 /ORGANISM="Elphidium margaritaceum" /LENGTH=331 /DNA_ID=CAMNT_0049343145 /DNA_START=103 /DNA_END=1098 /DNA_ORIENTATION=+